MSDAMADDDIEIVDAEVLVADGGPRPAPLPVVRRGLAPATVGAAVAATGFAAGVATAAVVHRRRSRRRRVASRSFLVDVHLLDR